MRERRVESEILETLPDDHPDAITGREDLLQVNAVMGNHRWMRRMVRQHVRPGWRITEIGAGDGALSRSFVEAGLCGPEQLHAFDLAGRPTTWPAAAAWTQGDLFRHPLPESEVLVANLFLHHFENPALRELGARLPASTELILAAEPARRWLHTWTGRLFCSLAQLNHVTRYDMQVSIRAGFRGAELPHALGLGPEWRWEARETPLGACRLLAWRVEG